MHCSRNNDLNRWHECTHEEYKMTVDPRRVKEVLYLRCIMTQWDVRSSARLHSESHDLPFHKDEEQHKNLHKTDSSNQHITLFSYIQ